MVPETGTFRSDSLVTVLRLFDRPLFRVAKQIAQMCPRNAYFFVEELLNIFECMLELQYLSNFGT